MNPGHRSANNKSEMHRPAFSVIKLHHPRVSRTCNQGSQHYLVEIISTVENKLLIDNELVRQYSTGKGLLTGKYKVFNYDQIS